MSWIKLLLVFCIIAFCIFIAHSFAQKYRERKSYFSQLYIFNERYLMELRYRRKPIVQFLKEYEYSGEFENSIKEYEKNRILSSKRVFLKTDEVKYCNDYFIMLGKGDSSSQLEFFSAQAKFLKDKKEESEKEAKTRSELYVKLGLLAGLCIVILIV